MNIYSIQQNKNQSHNIKSISNTVLSFSLIQPLKKDKIQKMEKLKSQTQARHNLGKLLQLKTK